MKTCSKSRLLLAGSSTALAAALSISAFSPALAQTAPVAPAGGGSTASEIVVTGSRIARTGFTTPVPVTVVGEAQIGQEAATTMATVIQQLPEFRPVSSPLAVSANNQNVGASTADLRGLGANRTLVLVDGQRFVGSTAAAPGQVAADAVDLNLLPTAIVLRTEIVTGGASASYGSDAVSGVVNVILDNKLNGFKGQAQYSETQYGDGLEYEGSAAYGHDFMGGKGHFVVSGEYVDNKGVLSRLDNGRPWSTQQNLPASVSNLCPVGTVASATCPTGGNGLPATIVLNNSNPAGTKTSGDAVGGLIVGATGAAAIYNDYVFNTPTAASPFQYGIFLNKGATMSGGQGPNSFNENFAFEAPVRHYSLYAHSDYEFTDWLSGHISVNYGDTHATTPTVQPRWLNPTTAASGTNASGIWIKGDNAFLPANIATALGNSAANGFSLGLLYDAYGPAVQTADRNTVRAVGSLDGKFNFLGDKPWTWSAYYQFGQSNYNFTTTNALYWPNFAKAIDAVTVTPGNVGTSGLPVGSVACRSTLTAPTNGCVPLNPFGNVVPSAAQRAYTSGTQWNNTSLDEQVLDGELQGDLFNLPAGPVTLAVGGEYRLDQIKGSEDPTSQLGSNGWQVVTTIIANGSNNIEEGFAELAVPVLKDVILAKNLNFDGAVRYSNYSTTGGVTSWKLGLVDDVTSWFRLRGTWSQDIRGPNVWDLYQTQLLNSVAGNDPLTGQQLIPQDTGGNPNLKPEVAYTFTGGAVFTAPSDSLLKGLSVSADYYRIKIDDLITTVSANTTLNNCEVKNNAASCALITRDPSAGVGPTGIPFITFLNAAEVNIASETTVGMDLELDYRRTLSDFFPGVPGNFDFHLIGNHTWELEQDVVGTVTYLAGVSGQVPWWTLNGQFSYNLDGLTVGATGRFISSQILSATTYAPCQGSAYTTAAAVPNETNTTSFNCIGAYAVFGLNAQYVMPYHGGNITYYMTIDNIFDRPPPFDTAGFASGVGPQYDLLGRNFHFGIRLRY